jgi:hypothetical protein
MNEKIPIIFLDNHSVRGHRLLDINSWKGESQKIIQSCISQLNLMNYTINSSTFAVKKAI